VSLSCSFFSIYGLSCFCSVFHRAKSILCRYVLKKIRVVQPTDRYELCGNVLADAAYCDSQESIYRGVQRFVGEKGSQRVKTKLLNGNILHGLVKIFCCYAPHSFF